MDIFTISKIVYKKQQIQALEREISDLEGLPDKAIKNPQDSIYHEMLASLTPEN